MDNILKELNVISIRDLKLLCKFYNCNTVNQLANFLTNEQKANFSNSQVVFIKNYLPSIVKKAREINDTFGNLNPHFIQELIRKATEFDSKITKTEKNALKKDFERNYPQEFKQYMKLFEIFTESQDRDWLVDRYISGGIKRIEDINSRAKPAIIDFKQLVKKGLLSGHISQFSSLSELEATIEPFLKKIDLVEKGKSDIIYQDSQFRLIELHDEKAACYYGQGTKWCTAATKGDNMFDEYKKEGPVFVLLVKNPRYKGEKYQFRFFPDFLIANEKDEELSLSEMETLYPNVKTILEKGYIKMMKNPKDVQMFNTDIVTITPHFIISITTDEPLYLRNKWSSLETFNFVLYTDTKFIIGVDENPDNLPELTTDELYSFRNSDYTHLVLNNYFNQNVDSLPTNLKYLQFGDFFNQSVDYLPKNLEYLEFGWKFNKSIEHLPNTITHLILGSDFNQPITKLPLNLQQLTISKEYDLPINLPTHVKLNYLY